MPSVRVCVLILIWINDPTNVFRLRFVQFFSLWLSANYGGGGGVLVYVFFLLIDILLYLGEMGRFKLDKYILSTKD